MSIARESDHNQALRGAMAAQTQTDPSDWFCVYKARYGMEVVFSVLKEHHGAGEVA